MIWRVRYRSTRLGAKAPLIAQWLGLKITAHDRQLIVACTLAQTCMYALYLPSSTVLGFRFKFVKIRKCRAHFKHDSADNSLLPGIEHSGNRTGQKVTREAMLKREIKRASRRENCLENELRMSNANENPNRRMRILVFWLFRQKWAGMSMWVSAGIVSRALLGGFWVEKWRAKLSFIPAVPTREFARSGIGCC